MLFTARTRQFHDGLHLSSRHIAKKPIPSCIICSLHHRDASVLSDHAQSRARLRAWRRGMCFQVPALPSHLAAAAQTSNATYDKYPSYSKLQHTSTQLFDSQRCPPARTLSSWREGPRRNPAKFVYK